MADHKRQPDINQYYRTRRHKPQTLTCIHCRKPLYCTNELVSFLPIVPFFILGGIYAVTPNLLLLIPCILLILLDPLIKRYVFRFLRFEVDFDQERGKLVKRK